MPTLTSGAFCEIAQEFRTADYLADIVGYRHTEVARITRRESEP